MRLSTFTISINHPPPTIQQLYNKRRNLLKSYLISKSCCTFASRNRSITANAFFYLVALMVWWGRESTPLTPKSNPSLSEMSSKTERLRVLFKKESVLLFSNALFFDICSKFEYFLYFCNCYIQVLN